MKKEALFSAASKQEKIGFAGMLRLNNAAAVPLDISRFGVVKMPGRRLFSYPEAVFWHNSGAKYLKRAVHVPMNRTFLLSGQFQDFFGVFVQDRLFFRFGKL